MTFPTKYSKKTDITPNNKKLSKNFKDNTDRYFKNISQDVV